MSGSCPYGKRCCFIHTELPGSAPLPGQDNSPSHVSGETRARSDSDPNEGSTSLLARISAKRQEPLAANKAGSLSTTPPSAGFGGRPGSLRVDTSVLDPNAAKQNKSAFPTFTHNGILVSSNEEPPAMSPGPVTAAPDFGRHAAARMDIVGTQVSNVFYICCRQMLKSFPSDLFARPTSIRTSVTRSTAVKSNLI